MFFYAWGRLKEQLILHADEADYTFPEGLSAQTQYIHNIDVQKLAYWYFPVKNPKAVVILVHGYKNPGGKSLMLSHAKYLHDAGYSTAILDLRSHGESEGEKISLGVEEWKDVVTMYDLMHSLPENQRKKIGYLGISMGAVSALNAQGLTQKGDFVIASVPFANVDSLLQYQIKMAGFNPNLFFPFMKLAAYVELGVDYEKYTPTSTAKNINAPVLIMAATDDGTVNFEDARLVYDQINTPKESIIFKTGHDVFYHDPEGFKKAVLDYLELQLKK